MFILSLVFLLLPIDCFDELGSINISSGRSLLGLLPAKISNQLRLHEIEFFRNMRERLSSRYLLTPRVPNEYRDVSLVLQESS